MKILQRTHETSKEVSKLLKNCITASACVLYLLWAPTTQANEIDWWLTATVTSYHNNRNTTNHTKHNEENYGIGFERAVFKDTIMAGGVYRNSYWNTSHYLGLTYVPIQYGYFHFGAFGGIVTGYDDPFGIKILPTMSIQGKRFGVNLGVLPARDSRVISVIGLQVKVRIK